MRRNVVLAGSIAALLLLAACSSQGGGPSGSPSATPTPTATVATTLDPCQLVTAAEASTLSGATFGAGIEESTGGTGKRCTYGSQTTNVFFVQVASSDNAADAQAAWATEEAAADADIASGFGGVTANFTKTDLTGLGDKAAVGTGSATIQGVTISAGVIYLLKGPNFLAFGDLTRATAPTADALQAQATTSLARMP